MKIHLLISIFTLALAPGSTIFSQENEAIFFEDSGDSVIYKNNYYSIFQNDSEVNQLLYIGVKGPASSPENRIGDYLFFLDEIVYERRILDKYSLNGAFYNLNSPLFSQFHQYYYGASIMLKYYIPTSQDRITGKTKTNLSGPYVAAGYRVYFRSSTSRSNYGSDLNGIAIQLGWQNRIFKYSYFNLVLNASLLTGEQQITTFGYRNDSWEFYFNPELKFGAVLGNNQENYQACKILNCQKDRDRLFKINILELFRRRNSLQGMSFEFEKKLGNGPWSINGGLGLSYSFYSFNFGDYLFDWEGFINPVLHGFKFTGFIEPRYYHNLKSRMLRGISGNGFSANFIGLEVSSNHWYTFVGAQNKNGTIRHQAFGVFANYGIQREIGSNLFCQVRAGLQYNHHNLPIVFARSAIPGYKGFGPGLDIKLGFAF